MAAATFDFTNLIIDLPAPTGGFLSIDVQKDIYSDWKVALKTAGNIAPPAFDVTAGDPLPDGSLTGVYFLRNDLGWRIRSTDENQEINFNGNLYPRDATVPKYIFRMGRTVSYELNLTANPRQINGDISDQIVEGTRTVQETLRLVLAATAGKVSGAGTTTVTIRDTDDTIDRIVATVDELGNRSVVVLDDT